MKEQRTDLKEFLRRESVIPNQKFEKKNAGLMKFGAQNIEEEEKSPDIKKSAERYFSVQNGDENLSIASEK